MTNEEINLTLYVLNYNAPSFRPLCILKSIKNGYSDIQARKSHGISPYAGCPSICRFIGDCPVCWESAIRKFRESGRDIPVL